MHYSTSSEILRIGQNSGAVCKNMAVMEMHYQQREHEAQVPLTLEACLAVLVDWLLSYLFDSPVVSTFE